MKHETLRFAPFSGLKPFTDLTDPSTLSAPHTIPLGEVVYSLRVLQPLLLGPWRPRRPPLSGRGRVLSRVLGFWRARPAAETPSLPVILTSSLHRRVLPTRRPCIHSDVALTRVLEVTCASHVTPEVLPFQIPPIAVWLLRELGFLFSRHHCK